MNKNRFIIP